MLSERQRRILVYIAAANGPITGADIACQLGVSLRTVQSEVARINRDRPLVLSSNRGYRLNPAAVDDLDSGLLEAVPEPDPSLDHAVLKALTATNGPVDVDDLSESLYLSTSTVERRLRGLRPTLSSFNLSIERASNKLRIEGREADKRRLIGHLIAEEASASFSSWERISSYFDNVDMDALRALIADVVGERGCRIKTGYAQGVIANVAIALCRMQANSHVHEAAPDAPRDDVEHAIARELCRRYASASGRDLYAEAGDIDYLASMFAGQIEPREGQVNISSTNDEALIATVEDVVERAFNSFQLRYKPSQALRGFALHVKALIERSGAIQITDVETLENVKRNCPFVYELSILIAKGISDAFHIEIEDGEIGFICIHVGLLIENTIAEEKVQILLVCDQYKGISGRIRDEIDRRFADVAIVSEFDGMDVGAELLDAADLVVTTRTTPLASCNVVFVSPFFTPSDYLKIENAVGICLREKRAARIKRLLEPFFDERLFMRGDLASKDEAIPYLGQRLVDLGIVNEGFIDSVLKREALSPTSFFGLFAVPHALEMDAERTMVAVMLSDAGIAWDNDTVHIVLMIAVCQEDRKRFMEIYDSIVRALCDKRRVQRLVGAETLEEFLEQLVYG